ncbi:MAG TPA: hypothetical protein PLY32_05635 [Salinivirgaceae bacterium]|nr:hypothetical protein [Salinivirgaceae bacterium]HQA76583.1 hypothetical protein [Salinivirgaceae bacterium]
MMSVSLKTAIAFICLFTLFSCNNNPFDIKLNDKVEINVTRLDSAMFEPDYESVVSNIDKFYVEYPDIFDIFMRRIARVGGPETRNFIDYLRLFLRNPEIRESYDSIKVVYGNFSKQKDEIEKAFSYIKHYIPDFQIPEIYTVVSGFNESILMTDSAITISLDKFLGQNSIFYERVSVPRYMRKRSNPEQLPVEVVRNWAYTEFENLDSVYNMANVMIYHGKIMYLMDAAFPKYPDHLKISFTENDIIWAKKSEKYMWAYILDKKLLFNTDLREIKKYTDDAPFVAVFGDDSPGRIGCWIGWQIVRSYMKKHPNITVNELLNINDHHQILIESGYSPN